MSEARRDFVELNGLRASYLDCGQGAPLVMLHGLMSNSWDFWFQFLGFQEQYRCIAPDLRGCGLSHTPDPGAVTLEQAVDDTLVFLDAVCPENAPVTLLGHSFGGVVALEVLARVPERLHKAVIVAAPAEMAGNPLINAAAPLFRGAEHVLTRNVIDFYAFNINVAPRNVTPDLRCALRKRNRYLSRSDVRAMASYFRCIKDWSLPDLSSASDVPTLLVFGAKDLLLSEKSIALLKRAIPNAQCEIVKNARHSPMYEKHEEFNALLKAFLSRAS